MELRDLAENGPLLYWASTGTGAALLALGAAGVLFPESSSSMYGVPTNGNAGTAYLRAAAVRDVSLGGIVLLLAQAGDRKVLGRCLLLVAVVAVGDTSVNLRHSPAPARSLPTHLGGIAGCCALAYLLLRGKRALKR